MPDIHLHNLSSLSILLFIIAGGTFFFAAFAFRHRKAIGGTSFIILMLMMSIYASGYAFEIASADFKTAMFFSNVQYFGIPFIPFFLYTLIWKYLRHTNVMPLKLTVALLVIPVLTFFLHLTTDRHDLFYINPQLHFYKGLSILSFEKGLWYWINSLYTFSLVFFAMVHCIIRLLKDKKYRNNIALLIAVTAFPFGGYILYMTGLAPEHLDITPLSLGLSCPFLVIALFHVSLFDIGPVAREHIFENLDNGLLVTDSSDRMVDYNRSILFIFPELEKCSVGISIKNIYPNDNEDNPDLYQILNRDRTFAAEQDGEKRYYSIRKNIIPQTRQFLGGIIYVVADITEEKKLEEKLHTMATTDPLTGLKNRRNLLETGEKAIKHSLRYKHVLSVLFFDVDHFKKINDSWGHSAGDRVLIEIAQICTKQIRVSDIIGRYGGEEFVIILPETSYTAAVNVAQKLRSSIADMTILFEEQKIRVTASFGVAAFNGEESLYELFNRADQLLYKAKNEGRNRVC
jgi:diguanylate cyclase (GGDEF)-like protein/PAS domain S-box-containing protein